MYLQQDHENPLTRLKKNSWRHAHSLLPHCFTLHIHVLYTNYTHSYKCICTMQHWTFHTLFSQSITIQYHHTVTVYECLTIKIDQKPASITFVAPWQYWIGMIKPKSTFFNMTQNTFNRLLVIILCLPCNSFTWHVTAMDR